MTSLIRKLRHRISGRFDTISRRGTAPEKLSNTQQQFIAWNAQRLNISMGDSEQRYRQSWAAVEGGHRRADYRAFNDMSYDLYQVFSGDCETEIYSAYMMHGPMHFLRMLSYTDPQWPEDDPIMRHLESYLKVDIIDYGCGLAQRSRGIASVLHSKGVKVSLTLVDIPTIRKEFLVWMGEQNGITTVFLDSTQQTPIPALPAADMCIATEFFEHVYDPLPYFRNIDSALRDNALLLTNIADHQQEFMHVSPDLKALRTEIEQLGYEELQPCRLFKKTSKG
jgi:hypothetical protein